jgi:hypothetical protein
MNQLMDEMGLSPAEVNYALLKSLTAAAEIEKEI